MWRSERHSAGTHLGLRKQSGGARARVQKEHEKRGLGCFFLLPGVPIGGSPWGALTPHVFTVLGNPCGS